MKRILGGIALLVTLCTAQAAFGQTRAAQSLHLPSLWLDELTWIEVRDAVAAGYTNIIIPTAGIEQYGIHLPLSTNRHIVRATATHIADALGNTLIAPVVDIAAQGSANGTAGQPSYAGTITMPRAVLADILNYTAQNLYRHGFTQIFFIGDSPANQMAQAMVAKNLGGSGKRAYHIGSYYADDVQVRMLAELGYARESVGGHAGLRETAEMMAAAPEQVRRYRLETIPQSAYVARGAWGDNKLASEELGQRMLQLKVRSALEEICTQAAETPEGCGNI